MRWSPGVSIRWADQGNVVVLVRPVNILLKVVIITVDDPKEGSLNPERLLDGIEVSNVGPLQVLISCSECPEDGWT